MKLVSLRKNEMNGTTVLKFGKAYTGFPVTSGGIFFFVCYTERAKWERFSLKDFRPEIDAPLMVVENDQPAIDPGALGEEILKLTRAKDKPVKCPNCGAGVVYFNGEGVQQCTYCGDRF